jgi:hypothetical protein
MKVVLIEDRNLGITSFFLNQGLYVVEFENGLDPSIIKHYTEIHHCPTSTFLREASR